MVGDDDKSRAYFDGSRRCRMFVVVIVEVKVAKPILVQSGILFFDGIPKGNPSVLPIAVVSGFRFSWVIIKEVFAVI